MVTGPTVINPLLKRLKVKRSVANVLEAEGVLIDAVGAVVAIVALEAALGPTQGTPFVWGWHVVSRIGLGAVFGTLAALLLVILYRVATADSRRNRKRIYAFRCFRDFPKRQPDSFGKWYCGRKPLQAL